MDSEREMTEASRQPSSAPSTRAPEDQAAATVDALALEIPTSAILEPPIEEELPPEPDTDIVDEKPGERAASRRFIIKWLIPFYVLSMSISLLTAVYLALWGSADHSFTNVEHILALVVAALGPVIGFYFAEERK